MEKKYIELKRRIVYRGQVYDALESERIKSLNNISKPYYDGYADGLKTAIQILANDVEDVPAADVQEVKRGKWTRIDYEPFGHDCKCSVCGIKNDRASNFCPSCGADMRGK